MTQRNRQATERAKDLDQQLHQERLELVASTTLDESMRGDHDLHQLGHTDRSPGG